MKMTKQQAIEWIYTRRKQKRKGLLSEYQTHKCEAIEGWKWGGSYGTDLLKHHPIFAEVHPTLNKDVDFGNLPIGSHTKIWWLGTCNHKWDDSVKNRTKGIGCPYCRGLRVDTSNCLSTTHPKLASEWHPTKNGTLTPNDVTKGSHKKVWWLGQCRHSWQAAIHSRTIGNGCPLCHGLQVDTSNSLTTTSPEIAKQWHPSKNGNLTPNDVTSGSNKKVWWLGKCNHEWDATIANRTKQKQGCPYCNGKRVDEMNCLETMYPKVARMLHPSKNGKRTGKDITAFSHKKMWFILPNGKVLLSEVSGATRKYGKL